MARNLIKEQRRGQVPITDASDVHCGEEPAVFLKHLANALAFVQTGDPPRVPSILSTIYTFWFNLLPANCLGPDIAASPELEQARAEAKRQFRGIASVLILRDVLGVTIELASFRFGTVNALGSNAAYRGAFAGLFQSAPGFTGWWGTDMRYLQMKAGDKGDGEVLCILSPYTLFVPAATKLRPNEPIFWYDSAVGRWFDPTMDWVQDPGDAERNLGPGRPVETKTIRYLRGIIREWLNCSVGTDAAAEACRQRIQGYCGDGGRAADLVALLTQWKTEVEKLDREVLQCGLKSGLTSGGQCVQAPAFQAPLIDSYIDLAGPAAQPGGQVLERIPDGNSLFLDRLWLLADRQIADQWSALKTGTPGNAKFWFYPFKPQGFLALNTQAFFGAQPSVSAEELPNGDIRVKVETRAGSVSRDYKEQVETTASGALEIRMWPNFALPVTPDGAQCIVPDVAAHYLFRVRQQPVWEHEPQALVEPAPAPQAGARLELVALEKDQTPPGEVSGWMGFDTYRRAKFYRLPVMRSVAAGQSQARIPRGLVFPDCGVVLLRWSEPGVGAGIQTWHAGIDFGTSHTCVCIRPMGANNTEVRRFQQQTLTLLRTPAYPFHFGREGAAAVADFPYNYSNEQQLAPADYFPSQLIVHGAQVPGVALFLIRKGLILPRNIVLDNYDMPQLLREYPLDGARNDRPYYIFSDIKWTNRPHRPAFLAHLYKMILYEAARLPARVGSVVFSYPKAFTYAEQIGFEGECKTIFVQPNGIPATNMHFLTESEAVLCRSRQLGLARGNDHLILDIGGGTTDLLFDRAVGAGPPVQASYKIAGRCLNDFFAASKEVRDWLWKGTQDQLLKRQKSERKDELDKRVDPFLKGLLPGITGATARTYVDQCFFGLLSELAQLAGAGPEYDAACLEVRQVADGQPIAGQTVGQTLDQKRALCGFFYTVAILFGSLAYISGRLLNQGHPNLTGLRVDLVGNGSSLSSFLPEDGFEEFMRRMFQCGYGTLPAFFQLERDRNSKVWVAEGLALYDPAGAVLPPAPVQWNGWFPAVDRMGVTKVGPQLSFNQAEAEAVTQEHEAEVKVFIKALSRSMQGGRVGRHLLVPFAQNDIETELSGLVLLMHQTLQTGLVETAWEVQKDLNAAYKITDPADRASKIADARSREPGFIVAVRCLLETLKGRYAR